jgi:thymidylate synthase
MRIFENCREMHNEVKRDLHEMGTIVQLETMQDIKVKGNPEFDTLELSPYDFSIMSGEDRDQLITAFGLSLEWCKADFIERINGLRRNPGSAWELRRETWKPFIHKGKFAYTYGERIGRLINDGEVVPTNALEKIIDELATNHHSRQCVLPIFDARDDMPNLGGKKRVPCSLHYQFIIRDHALRMFYVMRSSDFHLHFNYDIWMASELQHYVAGALGIGVGRLSFFTGSLHLYRRDWDKATF